MAVSLLGPELRDHSLHFCVLEDHLGSPKCHGSKSDFPEAIMLKTEYALALCLTVTMGPELSSISYKAIDLGVNQSYSPHISLSTI